jgi:NAD(P)-dependent dehydrogenase (short-subunit alcohol dehydrogenase family)
LTGDSGLAGRHLLVTGAGGLGRVLAEEALDAGMRVTVLDKDVEALALLPSTNALRGVVADLTEVSSYGRLLQDAVAGAGPVNAFAATAAVIRRQHDLREVTEADWHFQVEINQKAVYFLTREVAEHMKGNGGGSIVLVSSAAGVTGGVQGSTVYGSTKAAVLATMHGFARLYIAAGVRINAVVPGTMDTPMLWVGQTEDTAAATAGLSGMGRVGLPIEIARPILFLLSDWASFISGTTVDVDGGWLYR